MKSFLQPQTIAALGGVQHTYTKRFLLQAASAGVATGEGSGQILIQGSIPFFCESIFITYPTVTQVSAALVDDGVCRITLQLMQNTSVQLFSDAANLSLFAIPGRITTQSALDPVGGAPFPGSAPHIDGFSWYTYMAGGTQLIHNFMNYANVDAEVFVFYRGYNLSSVFDTVEKFWAKVSQCQRAPSGF